MYGGKSEHMSTLKLTQHLKSNHKDLSMELTNCNANAGELVANAIEEVSEEELLLHMMIDSNLPLNFVEKLSC